MKGPITLVLISALVAAPLFADTTVTKSAQTQTEETVGNTSKYVGLKSGAAIILTRRSEMRTAAASEVQGEQTELMDVAGVVAAIERAEVAAEAEVDKLLWFGCGGLLNVVGVVVASSVIPGPPQSHLIGKSPKYVDFFTNAYKQRTEEIQRKYATIGCLVNTVVLSGAFFLYLLAALEPVSR